MYENLEDKLTSQYDMSRIQTQYADVSVILRSKVSYLDIEFMQIVRKEKVLYKWESPRPSYTPTLSFSPLTFNPALQ